MAGRDALHRSMMTLLTELVDGTPRDAAYVLNPGDSGLLASLGALSAAEASARPGGRSSVAAHVDHIRYGFELLSRWSRGEDPYTNANWSASWRRQQVSDAEWRTLQQALASEVRSATQALARLEEASDLEWTGAMAAVVHLAYHMGAIRQLAAATAGPKARD